MLTNEMGTANIYETDGDYYGLFQPTTPTFIRDWGEPWKPSVYIDGNSTEIRNGYPLNIARWTR
jgi:hypothetical protein